VLTEVKAYSSWRSAPTLLLDSEGSPASDLIQIRNIDGLDPVKGTVNTAGFGSVDGASFTGTSVLTRNIVLTLKPNPDWDTWTYEKLRRLLYSYFMPKLVVRLVFYSDDMIPVEIYGVVEDVIINMFSKEPELQVSIVCPDPYFTALEPTIITGISGATAEIDYPGNVEAGMIVRITHVSGAPNNLDIQMGDPKISLFGVTATVDSSNYFEMSSVPMRKYVQTVNIGDGVIENKLSNIRVQEGDLWPILQPGINEFKVISDDGLQDYELIYYARFGGL
jgi:hypothetical protein